MQVSNFPMGGLIGLKSVMHRISFRCKTKAQKQADDELTAIRKFHHSIRKVTKSTEDGATTNEAVGKFSIVHVKL